MPDFATLPGASSPAHAHLAIAVRDPMGNLPVRLLAIAWLDERPALRLITISTAADPFHIELDRCWGQISGHAMVLGGLESPPALHATWHGQPLR